ncbi:hypothetical protein GBAR_LOCUS28040 [Geodia barretti]|uniref:Uncharacterized protein n=1 Tax=Geodia barretti TaxID=519541 RepID=A0AA35TP24_GEOBA|nr:hypothetical protein GBAR_LOCUS28040 [Geodia barretti]
MATRFIDDVRYIHVGGPILTSSSSAVLPVAFDSYGGEKATQPFPERHAQAELCEG